jgi:hypothetical protein
VCYISKPTLEHTYIFFILVGFPIFLCPIAPKDKKYSNINDLRGAKSGAKVGQKWG